MSHEANSRDVEMKPRDDGYIVCRVILMRIPGGIRGDTGDSVDENELVVNC